jgi:hypothetical protein
MKYTELTMNTSQPKKQRAKRQKPITSASEIRVHVTYAEPSPEADQALDAVIERIWQYGKAHKYF